MNKHIMVWLFALIWEVYDYLFIDFNFLFDMLSFLSQTEIFLGILSVYIEKALILYLFIYVYNKTVRKSK